LKRRNFLTSMGWVSFWAATAAMLSGIGRSMFPNVLYEPSRRKKIGKPDHFPSDVMTTLTDEKIFVYNDPQEGIHAISAVCPHLGCVVSKTEEGFFCPCHGSYFDPAGKVKAGPAPRGLPWFKVSVAPDGQLIVDAGQEVQPGTRLKI